MLKLVSLLLMATITISSSGWADETQPQIIMDVPTQLVSTLSDQQLSTITGTFTVVADPLTGNVYLLDLRRPVGPVTFRVQGTSETPIYVLSDGRDLTGAGSASGEVIITPKGSLSVTYANAELGRTALWQFFPGDRAKH